MGAGGQGADGRKVAGPTWELLLSYEHEVRAQAYSLVCNKGYPLDAALREAWKDTVVKDRYFVTPLALQPKRALEGDRFPNAPAKFQKYESKKKPKIKGKGKGKGSKPPGNCASETPDGKKICFDFNAAGKKCARGEKCRFAHVCGICFRKGAPMGRCSHKD